MQNSSTSAILAGTPILSSTPSSSPSKPDHIFVAARLLADNLAANQPLDTPTLRAAMTVGFGADETTGAWQWRDAYDAAEVAACLLLRRYWQAMRRKDAQSAQPDLAMFQRLGRIHAALPSQTRRSETQNAMQQFSTPLAAGFMAATAAQIRKGDVVLEPSAGTGGLAVFAALMGAELHLNELETTRHGVLTRLFDDVGIHQHNAIHIHALMASAPKADVVVMNPPFSRDVNKPGIRNSQVTSEHIRAAWARLREGGRLVAITGDTTATADLLANLATNELGSGGLGHIAASLTFPRYTFGRQGTSYGTRLHVLDKIQSTESAESTEGKPTDRAAITEAFDDADAMMRRVLAIQPRAQISASPQPTTMAPSAYQSQTAFAFDAAGADGATHDNVRPDGVMSADYRQNPAAPQPVQGQVSVATDDIRPITYRAIDETDGQAPAQDSVFEPWAPRTFVIEGAQPHPTPLAEACAMAAIRSPMPTYQPQLPSSLITDGVLSAAQLEAVIYAGEAHARTLPTWFSRDRERGGDALTSHAEAGHAESGDGRFQLRRGWFLGDGTGAGKGRQAAGIIMDNFIQGRTKALWLSKTSKLYEDAKRDWCALGGATSDVFSLGAIRQTDSIAQPGGILFATYDTMRSGMMVPTAKAAKSTNDAGQEHPEENASAKPAKQSRLDQIVNWLGEGFDGVIIFDEAHAMGNAAGGETGVRGRKPASLRGIAGLELQNRLPDARIVYVSATGASTVNALAYATRLGLWRQDLFPFRSREHFVARMEEGGVAAAEIVARDLKALGLYLARTLSYDGVEVDLLEHELTDAQRHIYDKWAEAFLVIHQNLEAALRSSRVIDADGTTRNRNARAAARSAFESTKQRFFSHLLTAMKCPSLFKAIRADLEADRSVVVQITSTGEALMNAALDHIPPSQWQDITVNISPRDSVLTYLHNAFPVQMHVEYLDDSGNLRSRPLTDDAGNYVDDPAAVALRDRLILELALLPPVPSALDQLIWEFGDRAVCEITGRKRRIIRTDDRRYSLQRRSARSGLTEADAFMDDERRILVFSDAGGTGRSYHADRNARNNRRRVHYLLEPGWRADNAIQGLGRSHRTGQTQPPVIRPVSTDVKGEKRFIATIARRLDTLGAITRGQRNTASSFGEGGGMFRAEDNFESPYARQALRQFMKAIVDGGVPDCDLATFESITGLKLADNGTIRQELPPMHTFLNRMLALTIDRQNALFAHLERLIEGRIASAKMNGTWEVGVETIRADSLVIEDETLIPIKSDVLEQTRVITVHKRERIHKRQFDDMLARITVPDQTRFMRNQRSGGVAIVVPGITAIDEQGATRETLRFLRPGGGETKPVSEMPESAWSDSDSETVQRLWQRELATLPDYHDSTLYMVTGLLLPIWDKLGSKSPRVQRIITDDGQSVLGRILPEGDHRRLMRLVGIKTDIAPDAIWREILHELEIIRIEEGMRLAPRRLAGRTRVEIERHNGAHTDCLRGIGCVIELVGFRARIFVPDADVLTRLLERFGLAE